jgi:L-galactose dehydrogenase
MSTKNAQSMQYRRLGGTDLNVSLLGFGGSPLGDVYSPISPREGNRAVAFAIENGINFFDVSPYYGLTLAEDRLGNALRGKRHEVLLATKCGRYGLNDFDFSAKRIEKSLVESMRRLQTDYLDLYQVHDVEFGGAEQIIAETIPAMRKFQEQGKVRYVGITGYSLKMLLQIARSVKVDTILSYCRYNLLVTDMDHALTPFAQERGIGLINASPMHMGILTEQGAPDWHPAPAAVREAGRRAALFCRARSIEISEIALRFCIEHPYVSSTLVGMGTVDEVERNLRAFQMTMDGPLLNAVRSQMEPDLECVWPSGRPENCG